MSHIKEAQKIKDLYKESKDVKETSHLIISYVEQQIVDNNFNNIDKFIKLFLTNDIHKQIKYNILACLCFMEENKLMNEIINNIRTHLDEL